MKRWKKIICTVLSFLFCAGLFALDPFHIDINAEFGAIKGEINEYVFSKLDCDAEYMLSRLDWDVDFIKFVGASVDVVLFEHFYVGASGRLGFSGSSGSMQDYDWLNLEIKGRDKNWYDNHCWLTNYSKHDNELTKYIDGTFKVGGIINLPCQIFLLPSFSIQGQEFIFDGLDGYYQYVSQTKTPYDEDGALKEWSDDIEKKNLSGKVISYNQQRMFLFLGLKVYTTIVPRFRFELEGGFSPYVKIGALDTHWLIDMNFLDQPEGSGAWNVSGKVQFSFDKLCRLAVKADYQYVPVLKGYNYSKSTASKTYPPRPTLNTLGGASSELFSFSFAVTLYF